MALTIEPVPGTVSLRVTGDFATILTVPFDDDDRFLLGLSDGTLLLGTYDEGLRCAWRVARKGSGEIRIIGDTVLLEESAEWATVAIYDANLVEPVTPKALPLFPELDRWVA